MKSKGNIVFLGMMGSGKTSIGSLVSKKFKMDFYDTDQLIEKKLNTKISKIFQEKGEKFFRNLEEKITLQILRNKNIVVALGGGTFLNKKISSYPRSVCHGIITLGRDLIVSQAFVYVGNVTT